MKKYFLSAVLTLGLFLLTFSCSSDKVMTDNSAEIKQISDMAKSGIWRITNYNDSGQDETSDYTGYSFTFNENGTLIATNGTNTYSGTWSVSDDSSSDDNPDDIDFNIFFASPPNFEELSDDWDISSSSSVKIELIDVSGGNGGTDLLTFEKN
ncbi:MAG: hypothetical protein OEW87_04395 [Flavobacteriaceae bacterium]|nr:hypothetical protein [Flavobacteriaceae bacterium]